MTGRPCKEFKLSFQESQTQYYLLHCETLASLKVKPLPVQCELSYPFFAKVNPTAYNGAYLNLRPSHGFNIKTEINNVVHFVDDTKFFRMMKTRADHEES